MTVALVITLILLTVMVQNYTSADDKSVSLCDNGVSVSYVNYTTNKSENCGCVDERRCVRKCCQSGFYHYHYEDYSTKKFESVCIKRDNYTPFSVPIYKEAMRKYNVSAKFMIGMLNCGNLNWQYFKMNNSNPEERFYIQENGSLYYPHSIRKFYNNTRYCVDEEDGLTAYLCYSPEDPGRVLARLVNTTGMIISMPFLLLTFLVYAILPESNLHRKALMNYVMTLLLAYIFLVTVQLHPYKFEDFVCSSLGYLIIFFFLVSFFWMNVMCVDMWFAFSGLRGFNGRRLAEKKRFIIYSAYAYAVPVLHILVVLLLNNFGNPKSAYYPGVGMEKCFLRDNLPNFLYFYGPMAILITINVILFISTAVKIQKVKRETSMLKQSDSKRHSYEDDKQKFNLYVKLLFAMGINWTMEIISWAIQWKMGTQVPLYVWYLTDFCNAVYGVFIFFIFVFKKKIWRSLQKRYYVLIGKPYLGHSMSATQPTTRSSNYSTTDTALSDHRLSELKNVRGEERMLAQNAQN